MRKIIKLFIISIMIFGVYGCENTNTPSFGIPSIIGTQDIIYTIGDEMPDYLEGISAKDFLNNAILTINVDDDEVNYDLAGAYSVYYSVSDTQGSRIKVAIKVTVKKAAEELDYTFPYYEGLKSITYFIGQDIPNYKIGIKAFDEVDGELTNAIVYDEEGLDFGTPGTYIIYLNVKDRVGNEKNASFTIEVIANQQPTFAGYNRIYYYVGQETPNYLKLVEAYDQEDGILNDQIEVDDALVDLTSTGIYPLYYKVSDSYGYEIEQIVSVQVMENDQTFDVSNLNVYYINDTHGSILQSNSEMGLARIGNVVLDEYTKSPYETLFLSGGDLLQGNVLSNYFYGSSMIDMFNEMHLDVFTLGNHEFDWGLDKILEYFNPNTLGMSAKFPLLGANVFYKGTEVRPDHMDAYAIFNKGDLKIGVVGTIGEGIESSIAKSKVGAYEFADPTYWTNYYTEILKTEFDCDIVFAIIHDKDDYYNQQVSQGSGNLNVDAIFNGHLHSNDIEYKNGKPVIQSSSNARALGHLKFSISSQNEASITHAVNLDQSSDIRLNTENTVLKTLINGYVSQIDSLINEVILYSKESYGKIELTEFMAKIMRETANADVGIHNSGGTRKTLIKNQAITIGTTYEIFPFDNEIISAQILGSDLIRLFNNTSVEYSLRPGLNQADIVASQYYWVATNEYVFGNYEDFQNAKEVNYTGLYDRIRFIAELNRQKETSTEFVIN